MENDQCYAAQERAVTRYDGVELYRTENPQPPFETGISVQSGGRFCDAESRTTCPLTGQTKEREISKYRNLTILGTLMPCEAEHCERRRREGQSPFS